MPAMPVKVTPLFSPTGAAPSLDSEPWFVGMMDGISVKGKVNNGKNGASFGRVIYYLRVVERPQKR